MLKPVDTKISFPKLEEEILKFWKENKIFEKSVESRPADKPWAFVDGPPFITGLPHYGSLLSSIPKDVFPRFWTMKGYRVRRVWGWDCHGLPAENKVENKLGITRKKDIEEKVGIKKFIDECKAYVSEVSDEWEWYVDHIGRWVDFKNAYKTMDLPYMESVMWVFKQMYEKGYVYKGLRVSLYCPHCATPISNFEVAMDADNYKELPDAATTYKYELRAKSEVGSAENQKGKTYILAWSTTPWNKIVTPALAVNPKLTYVKVKQNDEYYILAKSTLNILKEEPKYEIVEEFKGEELVGKEYIPHYDYYKNELKEGEKEFVVIGGEFVTAEEGTGVVTIAAYGEEDLKAMQDQNIHIQIHLDEEGVVKSDVPLFGGMYYLKANKAVNDDLEKRGLIYKDEEVGHNVPLCWRCHTRLYYAPQDAWYVNVQMLKAEMKRTNEYVNWFPKHFKHGRFEKSLEQAPDWCISRSRYWGSPVPVWECECGERFVPGSIKELEDASGKKITDLHKPDIDEITVVCKKCGKDTKRVPEVLDSWIEAGSATFAERHFPFESAWGESFGEDNDPSTFFPPDFIGEYTGQIRAWFYVMHVIANALKLRENGQNYLAKNVIVEGVILGTDGRKMSKNYGNYPDPKLMLEQYGGDALRLYLMGSPVMHGEDILIAEEPYRNQVKGMMLILWNTYNFFVTYANLDSWKPHEQSSKGKAKSVLDKWILSLLNRLVLDVTKDLEAFDTVAAIDHIQHFVDHFSKWYIRRSRDRVGPSADKEEDKHAFYETSHTALVAICKLLAPIAPFISEAIFRNVTDEESVHLEQWPIADETQIDQELEKEMEEARVVVELAHAKRKAEQIKVRQPLRHIETTTIIPISGEVRTIIAAELNVKSISNNTGKEVSITLDTSITRELQEEGDAREIVRTIQEERKRLGTKLDQKVDVVLEDYPTAFADYIKKNALVNNLSKGLEFLVKPL